jgi:hypothetical protein
LNNKIDRDLRLARVEEEVLDYDCGWEARSSNEEMKQNRLIRHNQVTRDELKYLESRASTGESKAVVCMLHP